MWPNLSSAVVVIGALRVNSLLIYMGPILDLLYLEYTHVEVIVIIEMICYGSLVKLAFDPIALWFEHMTDGRICLQHRQ